MQASHSQLLLVPIFRKKNVINVIRIRAKNYISLVELVNLLHISRPNQNDQSKCDCQRSH